MSGTGSAFCYAVASTIIGVFVGWSLSVASKYFDRRKEANSFKAGLNAELYETKIFLALLTYLSYQAVNGLNKNILSWFVSILAKNEDLLDERENRILKTRKEQLNKTDAEIALWCSTSGQADESKGYTMKTIKTPFFDSNIGTLPLIEQSLHNSVVRIYRRINNINEEIERYNVYFLKTFDSNITEGNQNIIRVNINDSYTNIARQAKIIVDEISTIEKKLQ